MNERQYEDKLNNPGNWTKRAKIKFDDNIVIETLGDIIYYLMIRKLDTYFARGNSQCRHYRLRSIDDAQKAVNYYNIDCDLTQTKLAVELLYKDHLSKLKSGPILRRSFCSVVHKRVHNCVYTDSNLVTKEDINLILINNNMNYGKRS